MNTKLMFSSKETVWETPDELYKKLDREFQFNIDVCALPENTKNQNFYSPEIDGLKQHWKGTCWMNPPYGPVIGDWIKKAYEESLNGATVVCLIPARPDTKYWHKYCMKAHEIRFIQGRLKFVGAKNAAPFPSAIIIFKPKLEYPKISSYK